ncbi:hypothetical protein H2199_008449 [Coniosporium tulheliwenetii]|uniref:Uncharacterized protein n=1 Tax=Coniosporium tulheliwenetii TaxID=3383036 RepID=A0ACC2YJK7_9PEZI|nr:hypothetical protein H2199_008449 [Cladosporium sp. JES 115]
MNTSLTPAAEKSQEEDEEEDIRFVGDLNPEGIFLAAASPEVTTGSAEPGSVGIWLSRRAMNSIQVNHPRLQLRQSQSSSVYSPDPLVAKLLLPYLEDQCLRLLPKQEDLEGLSSIYFEEVHPLFPVLDKEAFHAMQDHLPAKVLLKQAICLAASTNIGAKRFLNLSNNTAHSHREFAEQMSLAMRTSVDLGLVKDRLVYVQILAILSLFTQLSDNWHQSAELCARAVSCIHTAGLHHQTQANRKDHDYVTRLFCSVWALDRLNAAFHGRPVQMHERDIGRDMEACFRQQEGCFQLFLRVVLLLDKVINLYRPSADGSEREWEGEFPVFEDLLQSAGALRVNSHLLATIETLYHAVAILSCRSQSLQEPSRSSASYVRQSLSAAKVTSIVGEEFHGQLSLLPIVPYAVSLSLRVAYRDLRLSKTPMFRTRARKLLLANCSVLRELGDMFWSAVVMADLAEQTIREMDKAFSSVVNAQHQEAVGESATNGGSGGNVRISDATRVVPSNGDDNTANASNLPNLEDSRTSFPYDYDTYTFDPSLFDTMPDLNIFEHFDPDFDLGAIDAALGDNINPSFPMSLLDFAG